MILFKLSVCASLSVAATLIHPVDFTVMIVDPSTDSDPVTASFSWTALDNVTFDGHNITYTVTVTPIQALPWRYQVSLLVPTSQPHWLQREAMKAAMAPLYSSQLQTQLVSG